MSAKAVGRLQENDENLKGQDNFCFDYNFQRYRVKYTDDCQVSLQASCTIDGSNGKSCDGNLNPSSYAPKCEVAVIYSWKYCNLENENINTDVSRSRIKLNGQSIGSVTNLGPQDGPQECKTYREEGKINVCAEKKTWLAINFFGKTNQSRRECQNYYSYRFDHNSPTNPPPLPSQSNMTPSRMPSTPPQVKTFTPSSLPLQVPSSRPTETFVPSLISQTSSIPSHKSSAPSTPSRSISPSPLISNLPSLPPAKKIPKKGAGARNLRSGV